MDEKYKHTICTICCMQLDVICNLSYIIKEKFNYMCCMQLKISCKIFFILMLCFDSMTNKSHTIVHWVFTIKITTSKPLQVTK